MVTDTVTDTVTDMDTETTTTVIMITKKKETFLRNYLKENRIKWIK